MTKRILAGLLSAALVLSLCGCSGMPYAAESEPEIVLPEPAPEVQNMISGEMIASRPQSVALHYVSGDGSSFSTITRSLAVSAGESVYEEAVDALLYNAASPDRMSFIPPEMQVIDTDYACGIVSIDLSLDADNIQSKQEYLMLLASISNTLLSMDGVRGVNVLTDGRSESIASLPIGAQTAPLSGITPTYAQFSAERDYFLESETGTITRNAILYFPTEVGEWFVPELREITFDSSDYASALIRALRNGPSERSCAITAIPESADLLVDNPSMTVTSSGERVLELNFSPTLRSYLAFSAIDEWELIGSIALTLCSFIPRLDAVRICIDNEPITECTIGEENHYYADGLVRREDFSSFIGSAVTLYLPSADGALDAVERAVSMVRQQSPLSLLYALFDDILVRENGEEVFPSDVYYDDILGVSLENGVASVNLSANFYRQSQMLSDAGERGVVYAIVNTLCELDGVSGVRFYIEGVSAETLAGNIYLKSVLLPNPGIVREEPTVWPEATQTP